MASAEGEEQQQGEAGARAVAALELEAVDLEQRLLAREAGDYDVDGDLDDDEDVDDLNDDDLLPAALRKIGLDDSDDDDDDDEVDFEGVGDPEGMLPHLLSRLETVMSALNQTEQENSALKEEIKHLMSDQEERIELRTELGEQLQERGLLMAKMAQQTLNDSETSFGIMEKIERLKAQSRREKEDFDKEIAKLDSELARAEAQQAAESVD